MIKKNIFLYLIFICVTTVVNAQYFTTDSLRVKKSEIVEAQIAKLTHELNLTENQQKQVYGLLLKRMNREISSDEAFKNELFRILTTKQKSVFLRLQELDKQSAKNVVNLNSLKSTQTTTAAQNSLTLNDASVIKDAMIGLNNHPNGSQTAYNNYSTYPRVSMHAWTYSGATMFKCSVMRFLFDEIPLGSHVVSATLYFYSDPTITSPSSAEGNSQLSGTNEFYIERITEAWNDLTVTWNNQPATTTDNRLLIPASVSTTENIQINMTDMVQYWVDKPELNYGIKMFLQTEVRYRSRNYGSMEHTNTSIHPKLVIEYDGPSFEFVYDDSGNRKSRQVIIIPNSLKSASVNSEPISESFNELNQVQPVKSSLGEFKISIYPNPTHGDLNLKLTGDTIPEKIIYKVFNTSGSMVCNGLLNSSVLQNIPIGSMPSGVYILIVQYGDNKKTWKIIKQ